MPATPVKYIWYRVQYFIAYILRFAITWYHLLIHPVTFFKTLNKSGVGIHKINVAGSIKERRKFNIVRLPLTPQDYLLLVVIALAATDSTPIEPIEKITGDVINDIVPGTLEKDLTDVASLLLVEFTLVSLLFVAYHLYKVLLGLRGSIMFTEFFIFSSSQILFILIFVFETLGALGVSIATSEAFWVFVLLILSLYYFLYLPLKLRTTGLLVVSRQRVFASYVAMSVLFGLVLMVLIWLGSLTAQAVDAEICSVLLSC